jgi:periplasmic copper chaperone A
MTTFTAPERRLPAVLSPGFLVPSVIVAAVVFALASPAFAHVEISSTDATAGQPSTMTLTVPNERDDAAAVQIDLRFPEGQPLTNVTAAATPGWTATVDAAGIVWSGGPLTGENEVALMFTGTLPAGVELLQFRALQTYDDGDIVRWIEPIPTDGPDPEFPAPLLRVAAAPTAPQATPPPEPQEETTGSTAAADDDTESPANTGEEDADTDSAANTGEEEEDDDASPVIIAIVAVVAVLAAGGGTLIYLRRRRAAS